MPTIYLDDNAYDKDLWAALVDADFIVITPPDAGTLGSSDPDHLECAASSGFVLLTFDIGFQEWSKEHISKGKSHSGIFIVYKDNDKKRDMTMHR